MVIGQVNASPVFSDCHHLSAVSMAPAGMWILAGNKIRSLRNHRKIMWREIQGTFSPTCIIHPLEISDCTVETFKGELYFSSQVYLLLIAIPM
jgi:hypothetical protein